MTIRSAANALWFARPSNRPVEGFDAVTALALECTRALEEKSEPLAALRDTLLPRLISGALRVKDAEKVIEVTA
jgi:type I restriction enzyme S subunit